MYLTQKVLVPIKVLIPRQTAYMAGITDGEGYIGMCVVRNRDPHARGSGPKRGADYPYPRVSIANTSIILLEWMKSTTGLGAISPVGERRKNSKQGYVGSLRIEEMYPFLSAIQDDLVIKDEQCVILLEYLTTAWEQPLTEDQLSLRWIMWEELRDLNKKGKHE